MPHEKLSKREWVRETLARYERQLVAYALRILGDLERARDVVQETFLKLWKADQTKIENHLAQWLFTVCRNLSLDVRRKEQRMNPTPPEIFDERRGTQPSQAAALAANEELSHVMQSVTQLPANQQEVLRLKFRSGLSYKEISQVTGLSVTNVGYLLHTAIKSLRAEMADEGGVQ